jgi:hypothetical protein
MAVTDAFTTQVVDRRVRTAGWWCLAAGLVGAAQAVVLLTWPPQVGREWFSYPFTSGGYVAAQASFALQHLPLLLGVAALLLLPAVQASRVARFGLVAGVVGLGLLVLMELVAISARDVLVDSARGDLIGNLYGPPVILIGIGLTVAGAALLRRGTVAWAGARWLPMVILLLGVYVFAPVTPAIMGGFVAGRFGIGSWMLLFAVFGFGLTRATATPDP